MERAVEDPGRSYVGVELRRDLVNQSNGMCKERGLGPGAQRVRQHLGRPAQAFSTRQREPFLHQFSRSVLQAPPAQAPRGGQRL
jgi:hypothetical protein